MHRVHAHDRIENRPIPSHTLHNLLSPPGHPQPPLPNSQDHSQGSTHPLISNRHHPPATHPSPPLTHPTFPLSHSPATYPPPSRPKHRPLLRTPTVIPPHIPKKHLLCSMPKCVLIDAYLAVPTRMDGNFHGESWACMSREHGWKPKGTGDGWGLGEGARHGRKSKAHLSSSCSHGTECVGVSSGRGTF